MKIIRINRSLAPGFLALVLLAVPALVRADTPPKEKPLTKNQRQYDLDQDGKLNDGEQAALKEATKAKAKATREANLAKYDADKSGKLEEGERALKKADEQAARDTRKADREAKKAAKEAVKP